ncbi:MAG: hypothetical protein KDA51_20925, partial [Planctomycetales bacterium]|nr:hypothetical protein [Planctomycetales bacterium]
ISTDEISTMLLTTNSTTQRRLFLEQQDRGAESAQYVAAKVAAALKPALKVRRDAKDGKKS